MALVELFERCFASFGPTVVAVCALSSPAAAMVAEKLATLKELERRPVCIGHDGPQSADLRAAFAELLTSIAASDLSNEEVCGGRDKHLAEEEAAAAEALLVRLDRVASRAWWEELWSSRFASSPTSAADFDSADLLALADPAADPPRLAGFLARAATASPQLASRAEATAKVLALVSPRLPKALASCDTSQTSAYSKIDIGSNCDGRGRRQAKASDLSYGLASWLRWLCWNEAVLVACLVRREDVSVLRPQQWLSTELDRLGWLQERASLELSSTLSKAILAAMVKAAQEAAQVWKSGVSCLCWLPLIGRTCSPSPPAFDFEALFGRASAYGKLEVALLEDVGRMMWSVAWSAATSVWLHPAAARDPLIRAERHLLRLTRGKRAPWRGVNLGGWFLLEPGPCSDFWESLPEAAQRTECEWDCCVALGPEAAAKRLGEHRRNYFTPADLAEIKASGLTHVRLPFGAWCIVGPRPGEPYIGPCLEELDRAVDMIEAAGLRVILNLHGTVGGESGDRPCGRLDPSWHLGCWDVSASLAVLKVVAERYAGRPSVCGLGVCNEPSMSIPRSVLSAYYEAAIDTVRSAGMRAGDVSILLPIYTEWRLSELLDAWARGYRKYEDVVFDLHLYQCFGTYWNAKRLGSQLQGARARSDLIRRLPACCVSEWSVALPGRAVGGLDEESEEFRGVLRRFAEAQLESYEAATHGWFFWTWKDREGIAWNMRRCVREGVFQVPR